MSEIEKHRRMWQRKPLLRRVYTGFHTLIAAHGAVGTSSLTVELGSGFAPIKRTIPECVCTEAEWNPWIDRVENAYRLSFAAGSVGNLILFDVFHHLQYPGTALEEFHRVLCTGGRLILFEPCISGLGMLVYGLFHPEPIRWQNEIQWKAPEGWCYQSAPYYAAQGNATRVFLGKRFRDRLLGWRVLESQRLAALFYLASGGYSGPQLYPTRILPLMRRLDGVLGRVPGLFATRLLVVLERV